jgi:nicotinate-nucleotide pyrophosphorylase (carboxylating)
VARLLDQRAARALPLRCLQLAYLRPTISHMDLQIDDRVLELIALAKWEDLGTGDVTASVLPDADDVGSFNLVAKVEGVFAGVRIAEPILAAYHQAIKVEWIDGTVDGMLLQNPPITLARLCGPVGAVLAAERVFLNFLQRLCGVATMTRRFVDAVAGTGVAILDTRKTTPGWRHLEKYAVRCGGGVNHRFGLHDAALIKDNHLAGIECDRLSATIFEMLNRLAEKGSRPSFVEVEADSLQQVEQLFKIVGIDVILLDNFSLDDLREAVSLRDACGLRGKIALEASGGVTLQTVRAISETGVDRISVGAITHSATALDLSLERV